MRRWLTRAREAHSVCTVYGHDSLLLSPLLMRPSPLQQCAAVLTALRGCERGARHTIRRPTCNVQFIRAAVTRGGILCRSWSQLEGHSHSFKRLSRTPPMRRQYLPWRGPLSRIRCPSYAIRIVHSHSQACVAPSPARAHAAPRSDRQIRTASLPSTPVQPGRRRRRRRLVELAVTSQRWEVNNCSGGDRSLGRPHWFYRSSALENHGRRPGLGRTDRPLRWVGRFSGGDM